MSSYPHQREGTILTHSKHPVSFTIYAGNAIKGSRIKGPKRMLASNPWKCMALELKEQGSDCDAFLRQAQDFYIASESARSTARPLLLYYSFLNLSKMLIKHKNHSKNLSSAVHGIGEHENIRKRFRLKSQTIKIRGSRKIAILNSFLEALDENALPIDKEYRIVDLLAQVPAIHRPFSHIINEAERLYLVSSGEFRYDHNTHECWAILRIKQSEFPGKSLNQLKKREYFKANLKQVESDEDSKGFLIFETEPVRYGRSPIEALKPLGKICKNAGIVSILTPNGHRYYLSNYEPIIRVPQLAASYMCIFYFGSVARYRPADLEKMLDSEFGWAIEELLSTQGHQFVYLLANALLDNEVVCPWALRSP